MFMPQPYWGGICLPLLAERMSLIEHPVQEILADSHNLNKISALHHLLRIYGSLAVMRREADNVATRKSKLVSTVSLDTVQEPTERRLARDVLAETGKSRTTGIAAKGGRSKKKADPAKCGAILAQELGYVCDCPDPASADWKLDVKKIKDAAARDRLLASTRCTKCHVAIEDLISGEELADLLGIALDE
jgi:hypothetical protein